MSPNGVLCTLHHDRRYLAERLAADRARVFERDGLRFCGMMRARLHEAFSERR
jgi:hypothetical protein